MKVHWNTVQNQISRSCGDEQLVEKTVLQLKSLYDFYDSQKTTWFFRNTRQLIRLGNYLVTAKDPEIILPGCADFSHRDGIYTYVELGSGIPLSAKIHEHTIRELKKIFPQVKITVLISESEIITQYFRQGKIDLFYRTKIAGSCNKMRSDMGVYAEPMGLLAFLQTFCIFLKLLSDKRGFEYLQKRFLRERSMRIKNIGLGSVPKSEFQHFMKLRAVASQYIHIVQLAERRKAMLLLSDNFEISLFRQFQLLRRSNLLLLGSRKAKQ